MSVSFVIKDKYETEVAYCDCLVGNCYHACKLGLNSESPDCYMKETYDNFVKYDNFNYNTTNTTKKQYIADNHWFVGGCPYCTYHSCMGEGIYEYRTPIVEFNLSNGNFIKFTSLIPLPIDEGEEYCGSIKGNDLHKVIESCELVLTKVGAIEIIEVDGITEYTESRTLANTNQHDSLFAVKTAAMWIDQIRCLRDMCTEALNSNTTVLFG